jgi:hypothetical protein
MRSSSWRAAIVLAAVFGVTPAASAAPARCIADAELEAAVGAQIRDGAFAVSTAALGDRPMCSGLTVAQAIQRLRQQYLPAPVPAAPPRPADTAQAPATEARAGAGAGNPGAAGMNVVLRYVGHHAFHRIEGRTFLQQPAVIAALTRAGVSPILRRSLDRYEVSAPIAETGGIVVAGGCVPHHCDTDHYRLMINPRSGGAALCLFRVSQALWHSGLGPRAAIGIPRVCSEDPRDAPAPIRAARDVSAGGVGAGYHEYGPGSPAADAAASAPARTDITGFLRFQDPSYCHSEALMRVFGDADDNGWAAIGPRGRVDFARSRDGDWTVLEGRVDAMWNGLRLDTLTFYFEPESDVLTRRLLFRDPPDAVGRVAQRLGFGLSRGSRTAGGGDAMEISIAITPESGGAAISCSQ